MIGILIAILVAALVYWICVALGLPSLIAIIACDPSPARGSRIRLSRALVRRFSARLADSGVMVGGIG